MDSPLSRVTSWHPRDLAAILSGQGVPPPSICALDDGRCLFYRGRSNGIHGEPEGGKSWLALVAAHQQLMVGGRVLMLDYEDDEHGVIERLRALGTPDSLISGPTFSYVRPEEPCPVDLGDLIYGPMFDMVIVDSTNEAMGLEGLDPISNRDAALFTRRVVRPFVLTGACVVLLDHVTKNREARGTWAIGAQQKRAMIRGASYSIESVNPFGRGLAGAAKIMVVKDTPGHVRRHVGVDMQVASFTLHSDGLTNRAVYGFSSPLPSHQATIDKVCAYLRVNPGAGKRALRQLSNSDLIDKVVAELIQAGMVRVEITGTLHAHFLVLED